MAARDTEDRQSKSSKRNIAHHERHTTTILKTAFSAKNLRCCFLAMRMCICGCSIKVLPELRYFSGGAASIFENAVMGAPTLPPHPCLIKMWDVWYNRFRDTLEDCLSRVTSHTVHVFSARAFSTPGISTAIFGGEVAQEGIC